MTEDDQQRRSKNIRLAWILAGLVVFIMVSSVPFWQGLAKVVQGN